MFSADSLSCFGFAKFGLGATGVKKPFFDERYAGSDLKERTGRDDYLRGATRCFDGDECVKSHLRKVPMHPLFSIFSGLCGLQRHGDRKGHGAIIQERVKGACPLTTKGCYQQTKK